MSKFGDWYVTYDEVPNKLRSQITRSVFPPSAEQAADFHLERWYVLTVVIISQMLQLL